jgi:enterochelin esterase-like enzyme
MKKSLFFLYMMVAAGLLSCSKGTTPQEEEPATGVPMNFEISVDEVKASKSAWENNDVIYVFFKGLENKYLVVTRSNGSWTCTSGGSTLLDTDFSALVEKNLTAVHLPVAVDVNYAEGKFSFTKDGAPVYNYYLFQTNKAYTVNGKTVSAKLSMQKPADFVQLSLPIESVEQAAHFVLSCPQIKPVACQSVNTDGGVNEVNLEPGAGLNGFGYSSSSGVVDIFSGRLVDPSATSYAFTLICDDGTVYSLTYNNALAAGNVCDFPALTDAQWDGADPAQTMQELRDDLVEFAPSVPNNSYGSVKTYQYLSKTAGHSKKVRVVLPPNYDKAQKYPVLFVLHGIFGDENSMLDESMGLRKMIANAVSDGKTKDMIVMLPQMFTSPTGEQPSGFSFDQQTMRYYDKFEDDLLEDLIPWAKENFSVAEGRNNMAITGFSLGGRESLYIGTQHTDVFGYVGAACPSAGIVPSTDQFMAHEGTIKNEADFRLKDGNPLPYILLISGGTNDNTAGDYPEQYHNILNNNGVDHVWHSITGTGHDGSSVRPHFYNFVRHIFR